MSSLMTGYFLPSFLLNILCLLLAISVLRFIFVCHSFYSVNFLPSRLTKFLE